MRRILLTVLKEWRKEVLRVKCTGASVPLRHATLRVAPHNRSISCVTYPYSERAGICAVFMTAAVYRIRRWAHLLCWPSSPMSYPVRNYRGRPQRYILCSRRTPEILSITKFATLPANELRIDLDACAQAVLPLIMQHILFYCVLLICSQNGCCNRNALHLLLENFFKNWLW